MYIFTRTRGMIGIALISMATLMFELLVNKALSFSTWGSFGYMIIGSAIFGFTIAGVVVAIWKPLDRFDVGILVSVASLLFSVSSVMSFICMNEVPFNFEDVFSRPILQVIFFTLWYLSLLVPFAMTGFVVTVLLVHFRDDSNKLYGADLIGAGLGCLLVVPLFPLLGAAGQYFVCSALGAFASLVFSGRRTLNVSIAALAVIVICSVVAPFVQSEYPVRTHQDKRGRSEHFRAGYIKYSLWSFLSKIEVAVIPERDSGMLWFDGGLMQSAIDRFDGDFIAEKDRVRANQATSIPFQMKTRENVLIIAPAGGRELRTALAWGANMITGVELDYSVVELVGNELDKYLGGIYRDKRVVSVNDEGRSFVRRSQDKYDVIQFISAYSTTAVHSGAINLASSYLVTKEAFDDYLDHLTSDGVVAIARDLNLRLFFTAWEALERRGLDPRDRIALVSGASLGRNTVFIKIEPFTSAELGVVEKVSRDRNMAVNYGPPALMSLVDAGCGLRSEPKTRELIEQFVATSDEQRDQFYDSFTYKVRPVTDDNPFFNDFRYIHVGIGSKDYFLTEELEEYMDKTWYVDLIPTHLIPRIVVLVEAAIFGILFLIFPLLRWKSDGLNHEWQKASIGFFFSLGLGFIWIEIVLLKTFILFLGSPVYSIAVVLFSMLVWAGVGSLLSEKLPRSLNARLLVMGSCLATCTVVVAFVFPGLLRSALVLPFWLRILFSVLLIAPMGITMGMPFPVGLAFLGKRGEAAIPWAWAVNGYATVVGVSTAALVAAHTGFLGLLILAGGVYVLGFLCLWWSHSIWSRRQGELTRHVIR